MPSSWIPEFTFLSSIQFPLFDALTIKLTVIVPVTENISIINIKSRFSITSTTGKFNSPQNSKEKAREEL